MRDITLNSTFRHHFTTRQFSDGVPTVLAGSPVISVHEEANDTFITGGITLDVSIGSSPVIGLNEVAIIATSGNGYELGKSYCIFISAGTVGGVSVVGEVVGHFTVALSAAAVDLANGTDGLTELAADIADVQTEADKIALTDAGVGVSGSVIEEVENRATPADVATELGTYDGPTDAEMIARTILSAAYFDPTTDDVDVRAIQANVITAASINANAITAAKINAAAITSTQAPNLDAAVSTRATPAQVATELATYDGPTDAEMIARTILSAAYFDPAADDVDVRSIQANTITAASINANAINAAKLDPDVTTEIVAGMNDLSTAEVLTQVNAALDTAISELTQTIPSATPSIRDGIMLMYMALRNRLDVTTSGADELQIFNNAGVVIATKALTDAAGDYSEAEMISGP